MDINLSLKTILVRDEEIKAYNGYRKKRLIKAEANMAGWVTPKGRVDVFRQNKGHLKFDRSVME